MMFQDTSLLTTNLVAQINIGLTIMQILLFATSLFLMLLVLIQRGKGGGLTGALGGMGGQSAFGSKAGDAFTKITIYTAVVWLMLCMVTIAKYNPPPAAEIKKNDGAETSSMGGDSMSGDADEEGEDGDSADEPSDTESTDNDQAETDSQPESDSNAENSDLEISGPEDATETGESDSNDGDSSSDGSETSTQSDSQN